jgi:hypothetical protein
MTYMFKIFVRLPRMFYNLYKEAQNVCVYLQQILRQREIERPNRTYAHIYVFEPCYENSCTRQQ